MTQTEINERLAEIARRIEALKRPYRPRRRRRRVRHLRVVHRAPCSAEMVLALALAYAAGKAVG